MKKHRAELAEARRASASQRKPEPVTRKRPAGQLPAKSKRPGKRPRQQPAPAQAKGREPAEESEVQPVTRKRPAGQQPLVELKRPRQPPTPEESASPERLRPVMRKRPAGPAPSKGDEQPRLPKPRRRADLGAELLEELLGTENTPKRRKLQGPARTPTFAAEDLEFSYLPPHFEI